MVKNYAALNKEGIDMLDKIIKNGAISATQAYECLSKRLSSPSERAS